MKDLKVKDLDPVLQNLFCSADLNSLAHPLLSEVDWSKCTNDERLKYAELMYYEGASARCLISNTSGTVTGQHRISDGNILCDAVNIKSGYLFLYTVGNWAEIISGPDEKEETKEPEFQPGEIVEWRTSKTGEPEWSKAEYHGKNRFGLYVISENTVACCVESIRKIQPDPDEELKQLAKEICKEWDDNKYFNAEVMLLEMGKRVKNKTR